MRHGGVWLAVALALAAGAAAAGHAGRYEDPVRSPRMIKFHHELDAAFATEIHARDIDDALMQKRLLRLSIEELKLARAAAAAAAGASDVLTKAEADQIDTLLEKAARFDDRAIFNATRRKAFIEEANELKGAAFRVADGAEKDSGGCIGAEAAFANALASNDAYCGSSKSETCKPGAGDDICILEGGNNVCDLGPGNDTCVALGGNDVCVGGPGNDACFLGGGSNTCDLGPGRDICVTGGGADTCKSGPGVDACDLGGGRNVCVSPSPADACNGRKAKPTPPPPPSGAHAGFSFPNIHLAWQAPPDNNGARDTYTFDVSGTACGSDPTRANWAIKTTTTGLPTFTLRNIFRFTNPYPVLNWNWPGSKNSQPAQLQAKLRLSSGTPRTITIETAKLGAGAGQIGGPTVSSTRVPVTATRVASC
jgi:hypothetical protein